MLKKFFCPPCLLILVLALAVIGGYFLLRGGYQAPAPVAPEVTAPEVQFKEGSLEEVQAKFTGTTLTDWPDYQKDPFCIDSSVIGKPELGGMGFHATKSELLEDQIVDPLNPEVLLVDAEDKIVGVEYMVQSDTQPSLFGAQFEATPAEGHPGFEVPHWDLHFWLIDNPLGSFAAFNPNLICPEGSLPPIPQEEVEAPQAREITVSGTEYRFSPGSITVSAGERVKVTFKNTGSILHNFVVKDLGISTKTIGSGQTDTIEFTAPQSGTYTFICSVPGHQVAGMEGSLEVE